ncbi:hypothetical protein [uncultured Duncaniella sp.]|uniref:hypothetical protein n=1 Tax=uncultured Duncaniella sp. TaxID=2768039 RepID=UPI002675040B|nr:hypothetical protein [uncultured Duncaniella sp.]MCI9173305.1 hypothetical protein [Muribaculaceae bacterium]
MATISISSPLDDYPLTSQIGDISAQTDSSKETVSLLNADSGHVLFTTTLYSFDGTVTLHDAASLIEEDMRNAGVSFRNYMLTIGDASIKINPVYCECVAPDLSVHDSFLTTFHSQRVYPDSMYVLNSVPNEDDVSLICLFKESDGSVGTHIFHAHAKAFSSGCARGSFAVLHATLNRALGRDVDMIAVTFRNGHRSKTYYILPGSPVVRFYFRNCFNAFDYMDLHGAIKKKTAVSRELAVCAGSASQYDRKINQTFDFQSEGLTEQESLSIAQIVSSHEVYLTDGNSFERILITDHTCDIDNNDDSLWTVKISWRYKDNRPHLSKEQISHLHMDGGIFTNEFTEQFL